MPTIQHYNGALKVRRKYGMRGYGIYARIIELIQSSPTFRIEYNLDDLVFDTREDKDVIRDIVENFGLFRIVDGYLEDAQMAETNVPEPKKTEEKPRPRVELATFDAIEPTQDGQEERSPASELFDKVKAAWNEIFARTYRVNRDIIPDAITWNNFMESSKTYSFQDFVDAFNRARTDSFNWQFKDAMKPSNMQRLLSLAEIERQAEAAKKAKEEEGLSFEQREVIDYANQKGWNW